MEIIRYLLIGFEHLKLSLQTNTTNKITNPIHTHVFNYENKTKNMNHQIYLHTSIEV